MTKPEQCDNPDRPAATCDAGPEPTREGERKGMTTAVARAYWRAWVAAREARQRAVEAAAKKAEKTRDPEPASPSSP